jgi:CRISPR-associated protein Cmr2
MDGDDMGKWLGGDRAVTLAETLHPEAEGWLRDSVRSVESLLSKERRMTPATHAAISRACGAFALSVVPALVQRYLAYLIYAGGDDLLALVSLDHALELTRELRLAFGGHLAIEDGLEAKEFSKGHGFYRVAGEVVQTFGHRAGLSGALVVFHHKYPLQAAVEESRLALEERAKKPPKDMLALSIIRRSGQATRCRLRWKNEAGTIDAVKDLARVSEVFEKGLLSPRLVSSLANLLHRPEARTGRLPTQAVHDLMRRELDRHWTKDEARMAGLTDEEGEKARTDVGAAIWRLRDQVPDQDQEEWLATLEAAVFLARGGR